MYKILTILSIIILTPLYAYGLCDIQNDSCISFDGCYLEQTLNGLRCNLCPAGYYNSNSLGITDTCTQCPTSYSVSEAGKIPNPDAYEDGQSECPWMCDVGYFDDAAHTQCTACPTNNIIQSGTLDITNIGQCVCNSGTSLIKTTQNSVDSYYCGQCGLNITPTTTNGVSTCECPVGSNRVHGESISGVRVECRCPTIDGYWDASTNKCACHNNKALTQNASGEWVCSTCIDSNATPDNNGICKCNANYYGEPNGLNTTCTACPAGTTGAAGATAKSACHMTQNTKFCDANGKCMKLLQNATNINQ